MDVLHVYVPKHSLTPCKSTNSEVFISIQFAMNIFYKAIIDLPFSHLYRLLTESWSVSSSIALQLKSIFGRITMASIREHFEHCDFFASTSRDKKFAFRAASSLESTTREQRVFLIFSACSNPYGNPFPYGVFILSAPSSLKQVWVTPSPYFYCFPSTFSSFLLL